LSISSLASLIFCSYLILYSEAGHMKLNKVLPVQDFAE